MMEGTLLKILPLALAASLSPTSLVMEIAILGRGGDGRRGSLEFLVGAALFLVSLGLAVMLVFNHVVIPFDYHELLSAWVDIILGIVIILLVGRSVFGEKKKAVPRVGASRRSYLVVGFLMMLINTSTEVPFIAACKDIADARLPLGGAVVLFVALLVMTLSLLAFPVVFSYAVPKRSEAMVDRFGSLITSYGNRLVKAIFLLVGAYLIVQGIRALF